MVTVTLSDETPRLKHDGPGLLSMSIADRDTLGSQFIITFKANHYLDRLVLHSLDFNHFEIFIKTLFCASSVFIVDFVNVQRLHYMM